VVEAVEEDVERAVEEELEADAVPQPVLPLLRRSLWRPAWIRMRRDFRRALQLQRLRPVAADAVAVVAVRHHALALPRQ
jgi:hypothetical protein